MTAHSDITPNRAACNPTAVAALSDDICAVARSLAGITTAIESAIGDNDTETAANLLDGARMIIANLYSQSDRVLRLDGNH